MKFLVSPDFTNKLASLDKQAIHIISEIIQEIRISDKNSLLNNQTNLAIKPLSQDIYLIESGDYKIYGTLGVDEESDYLLLLDIAYEARHAKISDNFISARNPAQNANINPRSNPAVDHQRNLMIDPSRNMMIDPNRNMMIDPRRNMLIDPSRNMMVDPRRNMMIDPNRNMMIDPRRNMMIDPRRNTLYGGPFIYDERLIQTDFIVKANEKIDLIFSKDVKYKGFSVATEGGNKNIFTPQNKYIEFWVPTSQDTYNRFDLRLRWLGIVA
ncbi:hypothetical protein [Pseudomonas tohonis]|uniref:hypothetical protein n=1 Tax=Pseudomonas tohonis TaxID=2725477 RepID=UPI001F48EB63|nr:hypothetical protein [Pseudomonas tohonis]